MRSPVSPPACPPDLDAAPVTVCLGSTPAAAARTRVALPDDPDAGSGRPAFPRARGYEILSVIGHGGMGIVYEARHLELNRRAAIKTLRGGVFADTESRARFRAEAEAIAKLQHPNIIQVFEVGTLDPVPGAPGGGAFIALELVDGGSLSQRARTPQPPRDAARVVETLARAAHAAHLVGVVHRDLKPANVLLTRDGEPKIADFGIAKQIEGEHADAGPLTRAGTVMGTPEYMAPEQFAEAKAAPAIDVYALGVILYELLTGRVPFQGATFSDTLTLALHQEPVPPSRLQPGVPRDLEVVCLKCLEKAPARRYESAEALAADLERWAAGRPIVARPVSALGRGVRWARRNPTVAGLSLAVLVVALAGVAGVVWMWRDAEASADAAGVAAREARDAATKERWERYRAGVVAASGALRLGDTNAARRALDEAPEEHRDWVWHLLRAQLDRSREVLAWPAPTDGWARVTPGGTHALARGADGAAHVRDLRSGAAFRPLPAGTGWAVLSPDGATVARPGPDHTAVLADARTGETRAVLRGHAGPVGWGDFGPSGATFYTLSGGALCVWDAATGAQRRVLRDRDWASGGMYFSPDERTVLTFDPGPSGAVRLYDLGTGRERAALRGEESARFLTAAFTPTGDRVATVEAYPNNVVRLWSAADGRLLATFAGHENSVIALQFSPDGTRLATGSTDRTARVWDTTPGAPGAKPLHILKGHTGAINGCAFSPAGALGASGARLVTVSQDKTVAYWNAATGDQLAVLLGHTDEVHVATFTADGATVATAAIDGTVRLWDVPTVERDYAIKGHEKYVYSVAFRPDGARVASAAWDGTARVWDARTGRQLLALKHDTPIVPSVAYHPGGDLLATVARDDRVRLWDANTGELLRSWAAPTSGWQDTRVAFSPRGDLLASGANDGTVRLWDVRTGAGYAVFEKHGTPVRDVSFSPDGKLLASGGEYGDDTVRIWDVDAKSPVAVLRGHTASAYALAWNPAGTLVASGSTDGTVRLWDTRTWTQAGLLKHGIKVYGVAFTPDGKLLAAGCADNLIRFWDVATRQEMAALRGHSGYVHSVAFSADGARLVSGSGDTTIRIWDARPRR